MFSAPGGAQRPELGQEGGMMMAGRAAALSGREPGEGADGRGAAGMLLLQPR